MPLKSILCNFSVNDRFNLGRVLAAALRRIEGSGFDIDFYYKAPGFRRHESGVYSVDLAGLLCIGLHTNGLIPEAYHSFDTRQWQCDRETLTKAGLNFELFQELEAHIDQLEGRIEIEELVKQLAPPQFRLCGNDPDPHYVLFIEASPVGWPVFSRHGARILADKVVQKCWIPIPQGDDLDRYIQHHLELPEEHVFDLANEDRELQYKADPVVVAV